MEFDEQKVQRSIDRILDDGVNWFLSAGPDKYQELLAHVEQGKDKHPPGSVEFMLYVAAGIGLGTIAMRASQLLVSDELKDN